MKNKREKEQKIRGVFERPKGSGVWWINYYVEGQQHREKVGRKSAAIELYRKRKEDARAGRKLPVMRQRVVTLSELIDDVLEFTVDHKDRRNYISKAEIVRREFGRRPASEISPQELSRWLSKHCESPATWNRYKAFVSLCYREGMGNKKVDSNPARLLRQRRESKGRYRFFSRDEYTRILDVISRRFPEHVAEFVVAVHTGMRLSEQYTVEWGQVDLTRHAIELDKTKNGDARTVHLNAVAVKALLGVKPHGAPASLRVFPRKRSQSRFDNRSWFIPCLAEADVSGAVWHTTRHTFCSWLAMAGASIKEIQNAAGHKTITQSARYAHLSPDHRLSVVERLAA